MNLVRKACFQIHAAARLLLVRSGPGACGIRHRYPTSGPLEADSETTGSVSAPSPAPPADSKVVIARDRDALDGRSDSGGATLLRFLLQECCRPLDGLRHALQCADAADSVDGAVEASASTATMSRDAHALLLIGRVADNENGRPIGDDGPRRERPTREVSTKFANGSFGGFLSTTFALGVFLIMDGCRR